MNADERQLISGLFDRMRRLSPVDKDGEAETLIAGEMRRTPDAAYLLVQTALVQDEALQRAEDRIRALESGTSSPLDGSSFTRGATARAMLLSRGEPPAGREGARLPESSQAMPVGREGRGDSASSFLHGALTAAAGVAGGLLIADAIRDLFDDLPAPAPGHSPSDDSHAVHSPEDPRSDHDPHIEEAVDDSDSNWDFSDFDI